jgi:hypothetical protein
MSESLDRDAVVRGNHLPSRVEIHPNIGETVMVFVGLPFNCSLLMIRPSHHGRVSVDANFEVCHIGDFYKRRATACMGDVTSLAVRSAILDSEPRRCESGAAHLPWSGV